MRSILNSAIFVIADLKLRKAMAAKALMFTCLTGSRTGEVLGMQWGEIADAAAGHFNCPHLQCPLINPDVYLSPEAAFRATMLARSTHLPTWL